MAKTLRSRIAAVAVAALGVGLIQATPAFATTAGSISADESITIVGTSTPEAVIEITLLDTAGDAYSLGSGETITARVSGVPGGTLLSTESDRTLHNASDLTLTEADAADGDTDAAASSSSDRSFNSSNTNTDTGVYYLNVIPADCLAGGSTNYCAVDAGEYTITLDLVSGAGILQRTTVKVQFVSSIALITPTVAVSTSAFGMAGTALGGATGNLVSVTVSDQNGGALRTDDNTAVVSVTPSVILSRSTYSAAADNLVDDGSTYGDATANNGVWSAQWASGSITANFVGTATITARVGTASATASQTIYAAGTMSATHSLVTVTGTGLINPSSDAYTSPLTNEKFTVTVVAKSSATAVVAGAPVRFKVTSTAASGDVTPTPSTTKYTTVVTDASGVASLNVQNLTPANGETVTIAISGAFTGGYPTNQVVTFSAPAASASTVTLEPLGSMVAKVGSANTFTVTVRDQFGAVMANTSVLLTHTGSNKPATALSSKMTDSKGQVTYTITDALATVANTDTLAVSSVNGTSISGVSSTVTYAAAAPAATAIKAYYSTTGTDATATAVVTGVPTTAISAADPININTSANLNASLSASGNIALRFDTDVKGVPVTLKASAGGHVLNAAGLPVAELTKYTDTNGDAFFQVYATGTGDITFTATSGTATSKAVVAYENAIADARYIAFTSSATTLTGGKFAAFTAKVTDRFGNPVEGVDVRVTLDGVGRLGSSSAKVLTGLETDENGVVQFESAASYAEAGSQKITATITDTTANIQIEDQANYVGSTIRSGVTAGVKSVSATVTVTASADPAAEAKASVATLATTVSSIQTAISTLVASVTATLTAMSASIAKIMKKLGIK